MRLRDITEGVNDDFLYHATEADAAVRILHQNKIEDRTSHSQSFNLRFDKIGVRPSEMKTTSPENLPAGVAPSPWITGVSLTRSLPFAKSWKRWGVVLSFDARSLRSRHRIIPLTYYVRHQENTSNIPEAEEFLLGPINNLSRYLSAIHISRATVDAITNMTVPFDDVEPSDYDAILNHPKLIVQDGKWKFLTRA